MTQGEVDRAPVLSGAGATPSRSTGCRGKACRNPIWLHSDALDVAVVAHGATLHRVIVRHLDGTGRDVVLAHADTDRIGADPGYLGATVGRLANRLRDGRFAVDGIEREVTTNDGRHALHGGTHGLDDRCWEVVERSPKQVVLRVVSPDGDQGFPGELTLTATYSVKGEHVTVAYRGVTDAATPVNIANHAYLNLAGEGSGTVDGHLLTVVAHHVTEVDDELIPTGVLLPTAGTALDLSSPRLLGEVRPEGHPQLTCAGGLDHNYVLAGRSDRHSGLRVAAVLSVPDFTMTLMTDQPGLQVYAGGQLDGTTQGPTSVAYGAGAGIALEAQNFPDAPHHETFPDSILRPGRVYGSTTTWCLRASVAASAAST